jgi:hypothetical protein
MSSTSYPFSQASGIETLTQYLERLMAVKRHNDRFNHTFQCKGLIIAPPEPVIHKPGPSLSFFSGAHHLMKPEPQIITPDIPADNVTAMDLFTCPCSTTIRVLKPYTQDSKVVTCPQCGSWHTILWQGE